MMLAAFLEHSVTNCSLVGVLCTAVPAALAPPTAPTPAEPPPCAELRVLAPGATSTTAADAAAGAAATADAAGTVTRGRACACRP